MSIFNDTISSPLSKESVHDLIERIYLGLFVLNSDGAKIIHVQSNEVFPLPELLKKRKIFEYKSGNICAMSSLQVDDQLPGVPVFSRHNNRTAIVLDCSKLCRGDAIDFMNRLSKMDTNSKPIVIIMNITDIPAEDVVHDNPLYVERILLHSWKEDTIHLSDKKFGNFSLKSTDFTVLFPVIESKISNLRLDYLKNDGYAHIDYVKDLNSFVRDYSESQDWLLKMGYIDFKIPEDWLP